MKKTFWAAAATILLIGTSAFAADVVAPAPAAFDWSGAYIGLNGGIAPGIGGNNWGLTSAPGITSVESFTGGLGGITVGDNWQKNKFVFGIEGDADIAGLSAVHTATAGFACGGTNCSTFVDSLGTLRARAGYALGSSGLLYVTGGLAGGYVLGHAGGGALPDNGQATQIGWTAGAGIEAALSSHLTAKVEGLYVDLGRLSLPTGCGGGCFTDVHFAVARVGLNYKF